MIEFMLNGQITDYEGDPDLPLMTYLPRGSGHHLPQRRMRPASRLWLAAWCRSMTRRCFPV